MSRYNREDGEGDVEVKSNTKLLRAIEWSIKNPLKVIIGVLGLILFILFIIVVVKFGILGGLNGELNDMEAEKQEILAKHKQMDEEY